MDHYPIHNQNPTRNGNGLIFEPEDYSEEEGAFPPRLPLERTVDWVADRAADYMHSKHPVIGEAIHAHHHYFRGPAVESARVLDYLALGAMVGGIAMATVIRIRDRK